MLVDVTIQIKPISLEMPANVAFVRFNAVPEVAIVVQTLVEPLFAVGILTVNSWHFALDFLTNCFVFSVS